MHRKTAPRVRDGRVQRKNTWKGARDDYIRRPQPYPIIDRTRPGRGYAHVLTRADIELFIDLLPGWDELARGLDAVVLAPGDWDAEGWYLPGVVAVCAWERGLWTHATRQYCMHNREILDALDVTREDHGSYVLCKWMEAQVRAFQLLDVLLHELGHHHDLMTTRSRREVARGESYAEAYARRHADAIRESYLVTFGH
jgi:hypothetical protein